MPLLLGAVIGFSAGFVALPPVMQTFPMQTFPGASIGGDMGATRTVSPGVGALGPTYVAETASDTAGFVGLTVSLLAVAATLWAVVSPR